MGRFSDYIDAVEEQAALNEDAMDTRIAEVRAEWETKAEPLRALAAALNELRDDLASRNVAVEVLDKTNYPVFNDWNPSLEFQLVKLNAFPARQSAHYTVKCWDGKYRITSKETSGRNEGQTEDLGVRMLGPENIEGLIRKAISSYPWWADERR